MKGYRGFSLIEVVVAILILMVGALAAATMQLTSTKANQAANNRQIAANLARQLLEAAEARSYAHADLNATGTSFVPPPNALNGGANPINAQGLGSGTGRSFTRTWRIQAAGGTLPATVNYKTITVRVSWNQAGTPQLLELSSIKGWGV